MSNPIDKIARSLGYYTKEELAAAEEKAYHEGCLSGIRSMKEKLYEAELRANEAKYDFDLIQVRVPKEQEAALFMELCYKLMPYMTVYNAGDEVCAYIKVNEHQGD